MFLESPGLSPRVKGGLKGIAILIVITCVDAINISNGLTKPPFGADWEMFPEPSALPAQLGSPNRQTCRVLRYLGKAGVILRHVNRS
jgi:hypothetical protein